ncbi:MAG: putative bifunctional diguanylate cyclase/phosphodiesterase [Acidiferrobacterales bacterium]
MDLRNLLRVYLKAAVIAALIIIPAGSIQVLGVLGYRLHEGDQFQARLLIIPIVVIAILGLLLGRVFYLGQKLRENSDKFRAVADVAEEFIYLRSVEGQYEYVSPSCNTLCGYRPEEFYAKPNLMDELVHPDDREHWLHHVRHINHAGAPESLDIRLIAKDGSTVWVSHFCSPVFDSNGQQTGVRSANVDITQRKAFEDRIEHMAYIDPLSDLPNRRSLERAIKQDIEVCRNKKSSFAVMFLDLDRFKYINDSYGHYLGDKLLRLIAKRLVTQAGNSLVTRFGGDEFVILAHDIPDAGQAIEFAEAIIDAIEEPFTVDDHVLYLTGSIGISFYPQDGTTTDELVKHADAAMYQSKLGRQDKVNLFSADLTRQAEAFVSIESDIRRALDAREFELYYQPKVRLHDGCIVGLEALARWNHPEKGLVAPDQFIPNAEETGLILPLGEQLLEQILGQMKAWQERGIQVPVAINISGRQFLDSRFCETAEEQILQSGVDPALIELEITEQVFLSDLDKTVIKLLRLKKHGIRIAIDDFGTGYSSLKYIKKLPVNIIKIDRSFVWGAVDDAKDVAILEAIASLCQGLSLTMVAEGIETEKHRQLIAAIGCEFAQGYLFYRPLPVNEIDQLLDK